MIPENALPDAGRFLRHVLNSPNPKRERRWVPLVTADASRPEGKWRAGSNRDMWFGWPKGEEGLLRSAQRQAEDEDRDVYIGTALYPEQKRDKNLIEAVISLSADQDRAPLPDPTSG